MILFLFVLTSLEPTTCATEPVAEQPLIVEAVEPLDTAEIYASDASITVDRVVASKSKRADHEIFAASVEPPLLSFHSLFFLALLLPVLFTVFLCYIKPPAPTLKKRVSLPSGRYGALLSSREFVRDIARLAEHIVMNDVHADFWSFDCWTPEAAEQLRLKLNSRERAPFFAPDKVGELQQKGEHDKAKCMVRRLRARWAVEFKQRYAPQLVEWIDSGRDYEKPAAVHLLNRKDAPPIIAVAFRGSKTLQDYAVTDVARSISFLPVPLGDLSELGIGANGNGEDENNHELGEMPPSAAAGDEVPPERRLLKPQATANLGSARFLPFLQHSEEPCVTLGCWKAYAGESGHGALDGDSPRARVIRSVEQLLQRHPDAKVVVTGHSLGGALATLCAFDLIAQSAAVRAAGPTTLIGFAVPRMFNQAFQAMSR